MAAGRYRLRRRADVDWQITPALTATNAVRIDHAEVSYSGVRQWRAA